MAKQLVITAGSGDQYILEYTRKSVETMERAGFIASDILNKPMTMLPTLFEGAFLEHHRKMKKPDIDRIYSQLPDKDKLLEKLVEMYNEPIATLMDEPDGDEGNMKWSADW